MNRILLSEHYATEPALDLISFPTAIDNTIRSTFTACPMKGFYSHFNRLSPAGTNVHLHAGGAFAHGMEATRRAFYERGMSAEDSIAIGVGSLIEFYGEYEAPPESPKSLDRMCGALEFYFSRHSLEDDFLVPYRDTSGGYGIEFSFAIPLPIEHPDTGEPILYCGRFDMLGRHTATEDLYLVDEKTTTSLGAQWSRNWNLDSKFTGYCWGAREYGLPVVGAVIRGVSILKTKYDTAEAIIYRPDWQINRWYEQLLEEVQEMKELYLGLKRPRMVLDKHSCNSYGGCTYERLCGSPEPARWVAINYELNQWNPLRREQEA